jgi:hypothetical protein
MKPESHPQSRIRICIQSPAVICLRRAGVSAGRRCDVWARSGAALGPPRMGVGGRGCPPNHRTFPTSAALPVSLTVIPSLG